MSRHRPPTRLAPAPVSATRPVGDATRETTLPDVRLPDEAVADLARRGGSAREALSRASVREAPGAREELELVEAFEAERPVRRPAGLAARLDVAVEGALATLDEARSVRRR